MTIFDRFESTGRIAGGPIYSVLSARAGDGKGADQYAVKLCRPPDEMGRDQNERQIQRFLEQADALKAAGTDGGKHWAPVHASGRLEDGAFYVTDRYEMHLGRLISGRVQSDERSLRAIISAIVDGLVELQDSSARPHGNLKASNVLMDRAGRAAFARIVLADPLPRGEVDADRHWTADLKAVGELLYALVEHKDFAGPQAWPIEPGERWSSLGPTAEQWRELCNALLAPDPTERVRTLDELAERIARLRVRRSRKPRWAAFIGLLVIVMAIGGYFIGLALTPGEVEQELSDRDYSEWSVLCGNFADALDDLKGDADRVSGIRDTLIELEGSGDLNATDLLKLLSGVEGARLNPRNYLPNAPASADRLSLRQKQYADEVDREDWSDIAAAYTFIEQSRKTMDTLWSYLLAEVEALEDTEAGYLPGVADYLRDYLSKLKVEERRELTLRNLVNELGDVVEIMRLEQQLLLAAGKVGAHQLILDESGDIVLRWYGKVCGESRRTRIGGIDDLRGLHSNLTGLDSLGLQLVNEYQGKWNDIVHVRFDEADGEVYDKPDVYIRAARPSEDVSPRSLLEKWLAEAPDYMIPTSDPYGSWPEDQATTAVKKLATDLTTLKDVVQETPGFNNEGIEDIESEIAAIGKDISALYARKNVIKKDRADIERDMAELQTRITDTDRSLQTRLAEVSGECKDALDSVRLLAQSVVVEDDPLNLNDAFRVWAEPMVPDDCTGLAQGVTPRSLESQLKDAKTALQNLNSGYAVLENWDPEHAPGAFYDSEAERNLNATRKDLLEEAVVRMIGSYGDMLDELDPTDQEHWKPYQDWLTKIESALADHRYIEVALQQGFPPDVALPDQLGESAPTLSEGSAGRNMKDILKRWNEDGEVGDDIRLCVGPIVTRVNRVSDIADTPEDKVNDLLTKFDTEPGWKSTEVIFAIWPRLVAEKGLPTTSIEDEEEFLAGVDEAIRRLAAEGVEGYVPEGSLGLEVDLKEDRKDRWLQHARAAASPSAVNVEADLRRVRGKMGNFGVTEDRFQELMEEPQRDRRILAYDFRLLEFIDGMPPLTSEKQVLKDYLSDFRNQEMPAAIADDEATVELIRTLDELISDDGPGDFSANSTGPGEKDWKLVDRDTANPLRPKWLIYSIADNEVAFRLIEPPPEGEDQNEVTYLCVDEVSVGLVIDIINQSNAAMWSEVIAALPLSNIRKRPRVWEVGDGRIELAPHWIPWPGRWGFPRDRPYYPGERDAWPEEPTLQHPMTWVPAHLAAYVANLAGCRLPTTLEWQAAWRQSGGGTAGANLRDRAWGSLQQHLIDMKPGMGTGRVNYPYADDGILHDAYPGAGTYSHARWDTEYDDGQIWPGRTDFGERTAFRNLVGNVQEFVLPHADLPDDLSISELASEPNAGGRTLSVIGASALSPPANDEGVAFPVDQPLELAGSVEKGAYSDVGFRLAFSANALLGQSFSDKLKDVLDESQLWFLRVSD